MPTTLWCWLRRTLQSVGARGRRLPEVAFGGLLAVLLALQPVVTPAYAQAAPSPTPAGGLIG